MVKTSEKSSDNLESLKIVGTMQALEQMTDSVYTESSLEEQESAFLSSSLVYNSDDDGFSSSDDGDDNTTVVIDENGNTVTTVTAENGDTVVTTTDPQGTTLSIVATSTDEDGNTVVSETDKYGNTVVTTTDPEGNTLSIVATTTDKNGNTIVTETDETGDTVVTTTDKNGTTVSVVTTTTDEDGYTVVSETDKYGNSVVTTTDANGNTISTSSTTVEADGTLIVTTTDETSTTVTTTTTTATSKTTTTSTTNKDGSTTTTTTTQDLSGKTISTTTTTTDKNGKSTTTTTAADGSTSTTTTDADGNKVVTTTDSSGNEVVTTTYANGDTKIVATDKNGYTTTTETSTTTETDKDGNTTVTVVTKTTDTNGSTTTTTASTTTDKNGNVVEDIDTETSSEHGFSTAAHENHMMGGNSVGVAIASLNHAQDMLLQVDLDWLEQNRLTFSAGIQFANDELSDMKSSAEEQKLSGYYEAYGMFAQGAASGVGIGTTLAATRSARNNINLQNKHIEREQSTLDLFDRADKNKQPPVIEAGDDTQKLRQSDVKQQSNRLIQDAVLKQPNPGQTNIHQSIEDAIAGDGFIGENKYILTNGEALPDGTIPQRMQQDGTSSLAGEALINRTTGRKIDVGAEGLEIDNQGYLLQRGTNNRIPILDGSGTPTGQYQKTTGFRVINHIDPEGYRVEINTGHRQEIGTGLPVRADGVVLDGNQGTASERKVTPDQCLKGVDDEGFILKIEGTSSSGNIRAVRDGSSLTRFVTKDEIRTGKVIRDVDGSQDFRGPKDLRNDLDVMPEDVEHTSLIGWGVSSARNRQLQSYRPANALGEVFGANPTTVSRQSLYTRGANATYRKWLSGGALENAGIVDAPHTNRQFNYRNKRIEEAFTTESMTATGKDKVALREATAKRLKEAQDSRATSLHEFTNTSTLYNAAFGALGSVLGGYMKILSSNHSYDAQCEAAFSKYEGTIANNFFGAASNWQSQASKAYDQSLSVLSSSLDSLRRAVSRG
jgi:hypothetical protein